MSGYADIVEKIKHQFPDAIVFEQNTCDEFPTLWVSKENIVGVLGLLKNDSALRFSQLYDLSAIDEQARNNRQGQPESKFTIVYLLLSYNRNQFIRIKVGLNASKASIPSVTPVWSSANWYEREVYDMFGVNFEGHPNLRRILMPGYWQGHPLQKAHPARATEMGQFKMPEEQMLEQQDILQFKPEEWGLKSHSKNNEDFMFLNLGPQHPGTHGILRLILQMDGEDIVNIVPDIGFHHRGAEKMGERQSWHTYIPYTDRVEYLSGVMNNLPYVMTVEKMGGIEVPDRAKVIRVMLCELFRISSHLVWYGTFAQDLGMMTPVFLTFYDRERLFTIIEAICGDRMHPNWFRIGGVAQDLPEGWETLVADFVKYFPPRLKEYDKMVMKNQIFKARTIGIGVYNTEEAIDWGVTGIGLRATGLEWDFRKKQPYSGYDQFDFEIPVAANGDCYDRAKLHVEEMRQSIRIVEQCLKNMPAGPYKSTNSLTTPPDKKHTMYDIETLINHFVNVTWGPVLPAGEGFCSVEASKGNNGYYLVSDGSTTSYRTRIRTPSFPHIQFVPQYSTGYTIADLMAILGSVDFVLSDIDR
ncbi:MAG: NADH-quinone oxidoreductase subunit C/D [Saprospiraceae bacterium]|jgi:NADH-quinone oxidoreductase subunit C/D|nr:NADH-quinone oxidoreductase subunit C/D [Saprospiraceae bacterium]